MLSDKEITTNNPKISVIIPVYNRAGLIQRSINSVLDQTYRNIEVIVVDDASTDNTKEKILEIKDERLKYIFNENNLGPSKSRNKAIAAAQGELIAFQDSDDEWYNNKLEKQVKLLLESSEETAAVYCRMVFIDLKTNEKKFENYEDVDYKENFTKGKSILTPSNVTVLIKKKVLDEVGYFDERLSSAEDTELAIRVSKKYKYKLLDEHLTLITRNHEQLTRNKKNFIHGREIIYEKYKNFLSDEILYGTCKIIANYYILTENYSKALEYIKKSFRHKIKIKNIFTYFGLIFTPFLIKYFYRRKYKDGIPPANDLKKIEKTV